MRVFVAGANPTHVQGLLRALATLLPPHLSCLAWTTHSNPSGETDVTLLLGLRQDDEAFLTADEMLRAQLMQQGMGFQVIHGEPHTHLEEAKHAVAQALRRRDPALAERWMRNEITPRWQGQCETCSDPECEHRLFSRWIAPDPSLK